MSFSTSAAVVCFIACHGGPADHFATFIENLSGDIGPVEVYASGPALKKFQERGVTVKPENSFSLDRISSQEEDILAEQIAKACSAALVVITDVGHAFDIKVQKALALQAPDAARFAYYDNPEAYVPGGYSEVAIQVMVAAQRVLFANSTLIDAPEFQHLDKVGIGYYPINQADKIAERRKLEQLFMRHALFVKNGLKDRGQKLLVYFGGNNEEYFSKAFPAFLALLEEGMNQSDFTNLVIVIQQHPGAKSKNLDGSMVLEWMDKYVEAQQVPKIILSDFSSDDAQTVADGALYYQTSMGPQFVLAGIPTIQIGHETFSDILVRNRLSPSVTDVGQFISVIDGLTHQKEPIPREIIFEGLGLKKDWLQTLEEAILPLEI